jgi:hypothetical protein
MKVVDKEMKIKCRFYYSNTCESGLEKKEIKSTYDTNLLLIFSHIFHTTQKK